MSKRSIPRTLCLALVGIATAACGADEPEEPAAEIPAEVVVQEPAGGGTPAVGAAAGVEIEAGELPPGVTLAMVEEGQRLYATVCTACHGPAGAGTALGPALNDTEWLNISGEFDEILNVVHTGVATPQQFPAPMPAMGGGSFNEEQVRALDAYVYSLSRQG